MKTLQELSHFLTCTLRWLSFEAIAYQLLLLAHQLVLFRVTDCATYGLIGATFSLVFLVVGLVDCGFEMSISPFFATLCSSKKALRRFVYLQLLPGLTLWFVITVVMFVVKSTVSTMSFPLFFVLSALVLVETIKKPARTLMHLAFLNKAVALIEVGTVLVYIASVWVGYGCGYSIGLPLIFILMFITSLVSLLLMIGMLYRFTATLPDGTAPYIAGSRIIKLRAFNYMNFLSHLFFSSNFLIPFFAFQFGLAYAGVLKLMSYIAYSITTVVRKIFGLTSDALFAQAQGMTIEARRRVFLQLTEKLHAVVYGIVIFFAVNYSKIVAHKSIVCAEQHSGPIMYLFLLICFSETLFIAYEKFYITHERAGRLLLFNFIMMALTYGVIFLSSYLSLIGILCALVVVRVGMFVALGIVSFFTWRIRPHVTMRPQYFAIALGIAYCFFIVFEKSR